MLSVCVLICLNLLCLGGSIKNISQNKKTNDPSSMQHWDLNLQPLGYESPLITTLAMLPPEQPLLVGILHDFIIEFLMSRNSCSFCFNIF